MISGIGATCPNGLGTRSQNTYDLLDATNVTVGSCTHDSAAYDCATYPGSTDCPALTSCPVQCNPTTLCPAVAASYCNGAPVQNDSCGNNCGPGTKTSGCGSLTCNWLVTAAPAPACYAVGATVAQPSCATNADCPPVPYTVAGCNETYSFCGCGTPCGSCTPSCLQASDICNGEVCGGANDGCGGACPTVTGTNTGTCFSCAPLSSPTGSNAFCCNGASVVACDASCVPNSAACIGHPLPSCM